MKKLTQLIFAKNVLLPMIAITTLVVGFLGSYAYATRYTKETTCSSICLSIEEYGFTKSEIAIKKGGFIEFGSADGKPHNLALGTGKKDHDNNSHEHSHDHTTGTESGEFTDGEAWRVQFKETGTYMIHDHFNPEYSVLVVVYEPR